MIFKRKYYPIILLLVFTLYLNAQEEKNGINAQIDAGYVFGGMIYNYNFIYNPGYYFDILAAKPLSKKEILGVGIGYTQFQEKEQFYSLKARVIGLTKKNKDCLYYSFTSGYSFGYDQDFNRLSDAGFKGGLLFDFGLGRKIKIGQFHLLLGVSYLHQMAKIKYELPDNETVKESVNFDLLKFNIGIIL